MRKRFSVFVCLIFVFILSLTGCAKNKKTICLNEKEYEISLGIEKEKISGKLFYHSVDDMEFIIESPKEISQTKFSYDGNGINVLYDSVEIDVGSFSGELYSLFAVLNSIGKTEIEISQKGKTSVNGESNQGKYTVVFDGEEEKITSIETNSVVFIFQ